MRLTRPTLLLACALLLPACAVGPDYRRPEASAPAAYKGAGDRIVATPRDDAPRGRWWALFGDPVLDGLMEQVAVSNQTLAAAQARHAQAQAAVRAARSGLFPTVGASGGAGRSGSGRGPEASRFDVGLDARWELDLWGRVRRGVEAARAGADAGAADVENARLSLQAELANAYFNLRVADVQRALLEDSVKAFLTSLDIARNRYDAGVAGKADVVQAESQVRSTEAQAIDLRATRAQLENAIAVLVGRAASGFSVPEAKFDPRIPQVPPGLPSTLLERRPDIAAAERRVAAANARIGVAQAAYFPSLSLTGSGGLASGAIESLVSAPSRVWSLGLGLAGTVLDFGTRGAQVDTARAAYDETVANYRQAVLEALQEVETHLALARILAEEEAVQQDATRLARESVTLTLNQYKAGTVSYLNVVQVQATRLAEERQAVALVGRRLAATVGLIRALGGGWD